MTLVVGLGNPVRRDDGVGLEVVRRLELAGLPAGVTAIEAGTVGIGLLDLIAGHERLVVVDAIDAGEPPGTVIELGLDELPSSGARHTFSPHESDLPTIIELGVRLGLEMPRRVAIIAVQVADCASFDEALSPAVAVVVDRVCRRVLEIVAD
jgi:hydrogenase maturation protease